MSCFFKNCNEERIALNDSDNADFGFSKTDKLEVPCLIPTTPIIGILVSLFISSVLRIEFSRKKSQNYNQRNKKP